MLENNVDYSNTSLIVNSLNSNLNKYFDLILGSNKNDIAKKIQKWENEIHTELTEHLQLFQKGKWNIYEKMSNVFKDKVFSKLFTVHAALTDPNPEMVKYKVSYSNISPFELFNSYKHIFTKTENYIETIAQNINFDEITKVEDLCQDFFNEEDMILPGVIGFGIRSEFLHKAFPEYLSLMTRRSHWCMYFITGSEEFIMQEKGFGKYTGKFRYSNQYTYEYPRFNFYCNIIFKNIEQYLLKYGIELKKELRFSYVNKFISESFKQKEDLFNMMHEWRKV